MTRHNLYGTVYYNGGRPFSSVIEAQSEEHARALAIQRRLGERLDDSRPLRTDVMGISWYVLRDAPTPGDLLAAAHEASFLGYVALSSGAASVDEILGDHGLVHELVHLACGDPHNREERLERVADLAKQIQHRVPGWPVYAEKIRMSE